MLIRSARDEVRPDTPLRLNAPAVDGTWQSAMPNAPLKMKTSNLATAANSGEKEVGAHDPSSIMSGPIPRRGLSPVEAAMYLGISPSKFDELRWDDRIGRVDAPYYAPSDALFAARILLPLCHDGDAHQIVGGTAAYDVERM